jgi:hypothetical protein
MSEYFLIDLEILKYASKRQHAAAYNEQYC